MIIINLIIKIINLIIFYINLKDFDIKLLTIESFIYNEFIKFSSNSKIILRNLKKN